MPTVALDPRDRTGHRADRAGGVAAGSAERAPGRGLCGPDAAMGRIGPEKRARPLEQNRQPNIAPGPLYAGHDGASIQPSFKSQRGALGKSPQSPQADHRRLHAPALAPLRRRPPQRRIFPRGLGKPSSTPEASRETDRLSLLLQTFETKEAELGHLAFCPASLRLVFSSTPR